MTGDNDFDYQGHTPDEILDSGWWGGWMFIIAVALLILCAVCGGVE